MRRVGLVIVGALSTGCPWVFGPPDLSNVPGPTAPDPTGATGTTGDTGPAPTPTGHTGDVAPLTFALQSAPSAAGVLLLMTAPDPEGRLAAGGTLEVSDGAEARTLAVPDELERWEPDGQSIALWSRPDPCADLDVTFTLTLSDAAGSVVSTGAVPQVLIGLGTVLEGTELFDLGALQSPGAACGASEQPGDIDRLSFLARDSGTWRLTATWSGNADLDLMLYDADFRPLNGSQGITQPEVLTHDLVEGQTYVLEVSHFAGPVASIWATTFEFVP